LTAIFESNALKTKAQKGCGGNAFFECFKIKFLSKNQPEIKSYNRIFRRYFFCKSQIFQGGVFEKTF
jgi:hypothetical protein